MNPFHKHDVSDFTVVFKPLAQPDQNPFDAAEHDRKLDESPGRGYANDRVKSPGDGGTSLTIEKLAIEVDSDVAASGHDTAYDRKSKVINRAIMDIGMGWYQWQLFVLCGFGWLADNLILQVVALTLPSLTSDFGPTSTQVRYTTCSLFVGLCIGASFWGIACDIIGRRLAFNTTLFIAGVFGLAVGGGSSWIGVCGLYAALGVGVGGNLPVDGVSIIVINRKIRALLIT